MNCRSLCRRAEVIQTLGRYIRACKRCDQQRLGTERQPEADMYVSGTSEYGDWGYIQVLFLAVQSMTFIILFHPGGMHSATVSLTFFSNHMGRSALIFYDFKTIGGMR